MSECICDGGFGLNLSCPVHSNQRPDPPTAKTASEPTTSQDALRERLEKVEYDLRNVHLLYGPAKELRAILALLTQSQGEKGTTTNTVRITTDELEALRRDGLLSDTGTQAEPEPVAWGVEYGWTPGYHIGDGPILELHYNEADAEEGARRYTEPHKNDKGYVVGLVRRAHPSTTERGRE